MLMFLDEPTSGLDSFTAFIIIQQLRDLAKCGKTIIFTIHQPSSDIYKIFDSILLLIQGKIIYQGRGDEAVSYFR
jgi:ABC-type multidrug transport system ATPase subunit